MKRLCFIKRSNPRMGQRGGVMMEAMIGLLIMAIVGGGLVHIVGRATVTQQDMALQDIAVRQMRDLLLRHRSDALDLCTNSQDISFPDGTNLEVSVHGCDLVNATVRMDGVDVPVNGVRAPLILSLESERLGLIRVGGNPSD